MEVIRKIKPNHFGLHTISKDMRVSFLISVTHGTGHNATSPSSRHFFKNLPHEYSYSGVSLSKPELPSNRVKCTIFTVSFNQSIRVSTIKIPIF